jgi:membrane protein
MGNLAHGASSRARRVRERVTAGGRRAGEAVLAVLPGRLQERARRTLRVAAAVRERASGDDLRTRAAALTFSAFLSLLPLVLLGLSTAGFAVSQTQSADWIRRIEGQIPGLDAFVQGQLATLESARLRLGVLGLVGVAWSASALAARATASLGAIFGLHPSALADRLRAFGAMLLLGLLFLLAIGANGVVAGIRSGGAAWVLAAGLLTLVSFVFFLIAYDVLTPGGPMKLRDHVPGAVLMAVGWQVLLTIGTQVIGRWIARSAAIYGAVASLFGMLIFLRLAMSLWLYGAELSAVRFTERHPASAGAPEADPALD